MLEPILEADFKPCWYGFRPDRRAQDAIAEIHYLTSTHPNYEWVLEADIEACFDEISHAAADGSGAATDRGQAGPGAGEGVPEIRAYLSRGSAHEDTHRHPARRDPLTAAGQHRPVGAGRALRPAMAEAMGTESNRVQAAPPRAAATGGSSATRTTSW